MAIKTELFNKDDLPDHLHEEINRYVEVIFTSLAPLMKDAEFMNHMMAALSWVSFLCIKEFVADHHQERAVLNQAKAILNNLEEFKHRDFFKEAMRS
jgi:hypothetical protein